MEPVINRTSDKIPQTILCSKRHGFSNELFLGSSKGMSKNKVSFEDHVVVQVDTSNSLTV